MRFRLLLLGVLLCFGAVGGRADDVAPSQADGIAAFLTSLRQLIDDLTKSPTIVVAEIGGRAVTRSEVANARRGMPLTDGTRGLDAVYRDAVQGLLASAH